MNITSIGTIYTPFKTTKGTPIQPIAGSDIEGRIEIFPEFKKGLKALDGFSNIFLIYQFHLSNNYSLEVIPFLDNKKRGVFATRAPSRPNNIGISIVMLISI